MNNDTKQVLILLKQDIKNQKSAATDSYLSTLNRLDRLEFAIDRILEQDEQS